MDIRRYSPSTAVSRYINGIPRYSSKTAFPGGNLSASSIYSLVSSYSYANSSSPVSGGTLTINGQSLGSYDYVIRSASTVSSFTSSDWFTNTQDSRSAFVFVNGDLTINSGQTFIPSVRKLFTVLYVNGNLTVNGTISMTARGANHSASGANIAATEIRLINGTYSGVLNPSVPSSGGSGASASIMGNGNANGVTGTSGSNGGCGGGGSGGVRNNTNTGTATSGAGSAGTSFTGGTGGGGVWTNGGSATAGSGVANGGAGGNGATEGNASAGGFGGAGNPAGTSVGPLTQTGGTGTGGVLFIVVNGQLLGNGTIEANGSSGGTYVGADLRGTSGGGGSGGGSITIFTSLNNSTCSVTANGGSGGTGTGSCSSGTCQGGNGGAGGNGTARVLLF